MVWLLHKPFEKDTAYKFKGSGDNERREREDVIARRRHRLHVRAVAVKSS